MRQVRRHPRYLVNWLVILSILLSLVTISPAPSAQAGVPTGRNSIPEAPLAPAETGTPTQTGTAITVPTATATSTSSGATSTFASTSTSTPSPSPFLTTTPTSTIATNTPVGTPTGGPPPTYTIGLPTTLPTITPIPDTNYVDQAIEQEREALLAQIDTLPTLTRTITGTHLMSGLLGGKIISPDGSFILGMRPGMVPLTETLVLRVEPRTFSVGDPRRTRNGQPLAHTFDLTATRLSNGEPVTSFSKEAVLIWNIDAGELAEAGVLGWPLRAYTYNEDRGIWQEILTRWKPETQQLIAMTQGFSLKAVGNGFDAVNNYLPTVNDFEVDLQSGSATVQHAFELPSGPGGFGPKLSLSYNSGSVDRVDATNQGPSSVGWGWSLGGISYIAATQHNFNGGGYQPWTASIVVDGVGGDLVKGTDGKWHSSNESYAKIEYTITSNDRQDDKWIIWTKDGTKYEFDLNAINYDHASGQEGWTTYRWMLSKATDVHNNVITYRYKFELNDGTIKEVEDAADEISSPSTKNIRTRAIYPFQIKYGGYDGSNSKILVEFSLDSRSDYTSNDTDSRLYQTKRITSVAVKRYQQGSGYATLRSYDFEQDYRIVLPIPGTATPTPTSCYPDGCPHLTLTGIVRKGTNGQNLPKTTFEYVRSGVCSSHGPSQYDLGKLCVASNGYGGAVNYYYDAAAGDLNQAYRRVRAKRVKDGLTPTAAAGASTAHDALYQYAHQGGHLNTMYISDECCGSFPIHAADNEFRGFTWVREQNPSGQVVDHYYSQDDKTKAKEWRTQMGKTEAFSESMNGGTVGNSVSDSDWATSGSVTHQLDPQDSNNGVWKVQPDSSVYPAVAYAERTAFSIRDGYDVAARIMIKANDPTPQPERKLEGKWLLVADNGPNPDYWGIKISRILNTGSNQWEYHAWAVWKSGANTGERFLGRVSGQTVPPPPRRDRQIALYNSQIPDSNHAWYWVKLHTSPDGRFAAQLYRQNGIYGAALDHIVIKSGDMIDTTNAIPVLPTGLTWKFRHEASIATANSYHTLIDQYSETRTIYSQSDQVFAVTEIGAEGRNTSNKLVGQGNPCDAMYIRFSYVSESSSTQYGAACCELGQVKRTKTTYRYDSYGNPSATFSYGDLAVSGDETSVHTFYNQNATAWIMNKVSDVNTYKTITENVGGTNFIAQTSYKYDGLASGTPTRGDVTEISQANLIAGQYQTAGPSVQTFGYDTYGNQTWKRDPNYSVSNDTTVTTSYDTYYNSFPIQVQYPNGRSDYTQWEYTLDMPKQTTDVNGLVTEHRYDVFGRPSHNWTTGYGTEANPNQRYYIPGAGQATVTPPFYISMTTLLGTTAGPNEHTWQMRWFDGRGRSIQDVSPNGGSNLIVTDTWYNIDSQVISATLPYAVTNSNPAQYNVPPTSMPNITKSYDGAGRPAQVTNPDGTYVRYDYNWLLYTGTVDEAGHQKWQVSDMLGRLEWVWENDTTGFTPSSVFTKYTYNNLNQLTQVARDSGGSLQTIATMQYDGLGRKSAMSDPDMGNWEYEYDKAGNLTKQRDSLYLQNSVAYPEHQIFFCYDKMGRIRSKFYGASHFTNCDNGGFNGTPDVKYYYDNDFGDASATYSWGKLRMAEVTVQGQGSEKANAHYYRYDQRGLLTREEITTTLSSRVYDTQYSYDIAGRMHTLTYPNPGTSEVVTQRYNQQKTGLPDQLLSNMEPTAAPVYAATYNVRGQMLTMQQGTAPYNNFVNTTYTYDDSSTKRGWLTNITVQSGSTPTTNLNLTMTYAANGNITQVQQSANDTGNQTFTNDFAYDGLDRLRVITSTLTTDEEYSFDALSRMTTRKLDGTSYGLTYNDPDHKDAPTGYRSNVYGYDKAGNQTSRVNTSTQGTQGRFFDAENRITQIISGTTTTDIIYDANGARLVKSVGVETASDAGTTRMACQAATWQNGANVSIQGHSITKSGSNYSWSDAGAFSQQSIASGQDGYVAVKAESASQHRMFGLAKGDTNQDYSDIDYALEMSGDGTLKIYEKGTYRGSFGSYSVGDVLRVAVESGTIKYYRNSNLLYTSGVSPGYPLSVDTSLYTPNGSIKETYLCRSTLVNVSRTLYVGSLYEEELTGGANPPYINYYSFGGKLVGMRRANQASGNGQYRIAGDHLGSSTLILDTSTPPQVVSRQYHKAYGEVAWQGGGTPMQGLTSIGYTGQRLDTDSGLMFYNARMYDAVLSHFVSADYIAADPDDSKTRHRYSYVSSNPLRYIDPSGHKPVERPEEYEAQPNTSGPDESDQVGDCHRVNRQACYAMSRQLRQLGFDLLLSQWDLHLLASLLQAIADMRSRFNWSPAEFMQRMGVTVDTTIFLQRSWGQPSDDLGDFLAPGGRISSARRITFYASSWQDTDLLKVTFVHELAHAWDHAATVQSGGVWPSGAGPGGVLSQGMAISPYIPRNSGRASDYAYKDNAEDWAESVAATVYPRHPRYQQPVRSTQGFWYSAERMHSSRRDYVCRQAGSCRP